MNTYSTNFELGDAPIRIMTVVEYLHGNITVIDRHHVVRPVVVALLAPLLDAARQHHNGPRIRLPAHSPEVVPRRVKRPLRHYEFPR